MEISDKIHSSFLSTINQKLKNNKIKKESVYESYNKLSSVLNENFQNILKEIYEEDENLQELLSRVEQNKDFIRSDDRDLIEEIKSEPFEIKIGLKKTEELVTKFFKINYQNLNEAPSFNLKESLYIISPKHVGIAKQIIRSKFDQQASREINSKIIWDSENNHLITVQRNSVFINESSVRRKFDVESQIECIDHCVATDYVAVGCQDGYAYIFDKRISGATTKKLLYRNNHQQRSALTLIKFSESGKYLAFSNYNNQVFIYKDSKYLSEKKAESNSNKVASVSCINISDHLAVIGNREGGVYVYSMLKDTWVTIRPFVNLIMTAFITSNYQKLIVVSEDLVKVYDYLFEEGTIGSAQPDNYTMPKSIDQAIMLKGNDKYLAVFVKKSLQIIDLEEKNNKYEVKGIFEFMILAMQYENLLKYWYFIE